MKLLLQLIIGVFLLVILVTGVSFFLNDGRGQEKSIPKQTLLQRVLDVKEEPSPYSIRWGTLLSCVVDQQGAPIADAKVTLTARLKKDCDGHPTEEAPDWHCTSVRTNEKGEFALPPEVWENDPDKKRRFTVCIEADNFLHRRVTMGENWGSDNDGKIDIFRVGRIEGVLIDPNGLPVANAPVRLDTYTEYDNPSSSCHGCFGGNAVTDEYGAFVFEKAPPGDHFVKFPGNTGGGCDSEADAKDKTIPYKEYVTWQMIQMADGETKADVFLDLRQSGLTVTGRVVDEYNRPMVGVEAQVYQNIIIYNDHGHSTFTNHLKNALTDEDGVYVLNHIPAGDYKLRADYPYEKGKNYDSGEAVDVYLSGSQELAFNLVLERQDGSLAKPAHELPLFEVPLPEDIKPHELMIVDKTGRGIAGATVEFENRYKYRDTNSYQNWAGAILTTDAQGRFILPQELQSEDEREISCRMTIRADGYASRFIQTDFWRVKKEPRIDLLRKGNIKGRLLDANGQLASGMVQLVSSMTAFKNPRVSTSGGGGSSTTFKGGIFEFQGLREGVHVLRFERRVEGERLRNQLAGATVVYMQDADIEDLTIDLRPAVCSIRGRVLDAKGKPVSKATVRLQKEIKLGQPYGSTSWPEIASSEPTNRKGEYVIENVMPGVYQLEAVHDGKQRKTSDKKTIGLSGDRTVELDLRLKH
ncbi:MAG: carboxypeptidase-like regulatory domain-containing protein [Planctomycetota bacterium]